MCVSIEIEIEENIQLGNGIIRVFEKNRMPAQTGIEFFHFIVWRNKNKHRKWSFYVARDVCSQWDYLIQSNFSMQTRNLRITLWRLRPDFFPFISCVEAAVISIFHRWQCCARYKMMELFFSLSPFSDLIHAHAQWSFDQKRNCVSYCDSMFWFERASQETSNRRSAI